MSVDRHRAGNGGASACGDGVWTSGDEGTTTERTADAAGGRAVRTGWSGGTMAFQGTGSVSGAAEAIERVEGEGWGLYHMAYSWVERKSRGVTVMAFRPV